MTALPIYSILFYIFAGALLAAALWVILAKNPVQAVLSLVLCFFIASLLWMMLQAEFLALVLIFVYVGAVMTLFLFVVMMLNVDMASHRDGFVRSLLWGLIVMAVLVGLMLMALWPSNGMSGATVVESGNNIENLGLLLFSDYLYPFEVAGVILLVAIIAAISLAFYGRKPDTKTQSISKQHLVTKASRLRIIKMKGGSHD